MPVKMVRDMRAGEIASARLIFGRCFYAVFQHGASTVTFEEFTEENLDRAIALSRLRGVTPIDRGVRTFGQKTSCASAGESNERKTHP